MDPAERQVADTLEGIRKDHRARYQWVAPRLVGRKVVDLGCGVGYGAAIMADAGAEAVRAIDNNQEALAYAGQHWARPQIEYVQAHLEEVCYPRDYDAVVAFEILEHLVNPATVLRTAREMAQDLYASVPNEDVLHFQPDTCPHHKRHYTPEQFEHLLNVSGWEVRGWWGQADPYADLEKDKAGRTLVVYAVAADEPKGGTWKDLKQPLPTPEHVAIVAMGASKISFINAAANAGDPHRLADQIWAVNSMGNVIKHDMLFHMDDLKVQEVRARERPDGNIAGMLRWMAKHDRPIMTCKRYDDYPMTEEYPLEGVLNHIGYPYLNTTVAQAVAYAMYLGVKKISLYGCDFSYPNVHKRERGRACVEFLLGMAAARGIHIEVAEDSTLLDACEPMESKVYGYDAEDLELAQTQNGWSVTRRPKDKLPTADEMELRYEHVSPEEVAQRNAEKEKAA